jgi:hypothetical protein
MIFLPEWDAVDITEETERFNALWLVASRENSPGLIARYRLDFPYWGFDEVEGSYSNRKNTPQQSNT